MKTFLFFKKLAENVPYPIGRFASNFPYSWRLGSTYTHFSKVINRFEKSDPAEKLNYVIEKLDAIVQHAQKNIPFYQELYGRSPLKIERLSDFAELPVITRQQVRKYTQNATGSYLLNTGGSTGEPLSFYVDREAWAREWAHMHFIWGRQGYRPQDLMFTMLGKNLFGTYSKYNAVHNEFRINPYMSAATNIENVRRLFFKYPVSFLQGYPSSIYNFMREIESCNDDTLSQTIMDKIKCVFLSSEFPMPYMIDYMQNVWNLHPISWYGHSEMCVLAYEIDSLGCYTPLHTYGYAEDVDGVLCGTSYNNFEMPLIRYSTGDIIESRLDDNELLQAFTITDGRVGDYISDRKGRSIPLTAMIFGRHHLIFNVADFVQVYQPVMGKVVLLVTLKKSESDRSINLSQLFDLRNLDVEFSLKILHKPVLSKSGKFKLLVSKEDFNEIICTNA